MTTDDLVDEKAIIGFWEKALLIIGSLFVGSLMGEIFIFEWLKDYVSSLPETGQLAMLFIGILIIAGGFLRRK
ncbi:hypothetical protein C9439_02190 [archaeon SCG-AAA382B04]|nr:hypothetical protein C9439_02190 [archaeon SCG-AAA382B04]